MSISDANSHVAPCKRRLRGGPQLPNCQCQPAGTGVRGAGASLTIAGLTANMSFFRTLPALGKTPLVGMNSSTLILVFPYVSAGLACVCSYIRGRTQNCQGFQTVSHGHNFCLSTTPVSPVLTATSDTAHGSFTLRKVLAHSCA